MHAGLIATYHNPLIVVDGADFDGTNDFMTRGGALTGAADSKTGILSTWLRLDGGDGAIQEIFRGEQLTSRFDLSRDSANKFSLIGLNAGATRLALASSSTHLAGATWLHILSSWDLANAVAHLYINDVSALAAGSTLSNNNLDYTLTAWTVGADSAGGAKLNGCLSELYFAPGQYLDFSLVHNRRKFISASGKPVHLGGSVGGTGALPTGVQPIVWHHIDDGELVANFATNRGTGGNFTITGTLDTASTSPSG